MAIMIINESAYDWVTATTTDFKLFREFASRLAPKMNKTPEQTTRNMGVHWEGVAYGEGVFLGSRVDHNNMMRYIVVASSTVSNMDEIRDIIFMSGWKATRLDIQITVSGTFDSYEMANMIRDTYHNRGAQPEISCINAGNLESGTVYIGSRKSEKMARIYVKKSGGEQADLFSRYEVKIGGRYIHEHKLNVMKYGHDEAMGRLIASHVANFGTIAGTGSKVIIDKVVSIAGGKGQSERVSVDRVRTEDKTIKWLYGQVSPAIERLANGHDWECRVELYRLINKWKEDFEEANVGYYEDMV